MLQRIAGASATDVDDVQVAVLVNHHHWHALDLVALDPVHEVLLQAALDPESGLYQNLELEPAVDLRRLEEVIVIVNR